MMPEQPPFSHFKFEHWVVGEVLRNHNDDIIRTSLNIKISSSLEDQCSSLFHVITDRCFSERDFPFLRSYPFSFCVCKKACLVKKHFPLGYESLEAEFILLFCYINISSKKCMGGFSHIKFVCKRSEGKFFIAIGAGRWLCASPEENSWGKLPNAKYLKCLNIFIKIGTNRIRDLKKKVTSFWKNVLH